MNSEGPSFSLARRSGVFLNMAIALSAVLALVVMVNYLALRHSKRFILSGNPELRLSPRTLQVLAQLTNTVHVTVYYDSDDDLYSRVIGLLKEYQFASPKIEVERVDYIRDVAAARMVKAKYGLSQVSDKNLVIFDCANGGKRMVSSGDLSDYDVSNVIQGRDREVRRTHFRGELAFTSALFSISTARPLKAYFLTGHGEHDAESTDQAIGYSKFAAVLKDECNIPGERLALLTAPEVPADCNLLIIAGPKDPFSKDELAKLQKYLDQGGRMLVLFNYYSLGKPTGLEKLLAQNDVVVGNNLVVDKGNSLTLTGGAILPSLQGSHPIVARLQNSHVCLYLPRSIHQAKSSSPRSGGAEGEELLFTGPNSITFNDVRGSAPQPNPSLDVRGPAPLMTVVERGAVPGVSADRGATRLAVVGDSFFLQNDGIESVANRDFAAAVANWLVNQNVLLSDVAPRPIKHYQITMTQTQLSVARWILLVGLPGGVLLLGALVWWQRRT
jgi:hypothetical protein